MPNANGVPSIRGLPTAAAAGRQPARTAFPVPFVTRERGASTFETRARGGGRTRDTAQAVTGGGETSPLLRDREEDERNSPPATATVASSRKSAKTGNKSKSSGLATVICLCNLHWYMVVPHPQWSRSTGTTQRPYPIHRDVDPLFFNLGHHTPPLTSARQGQEQLSLPLPRFDSKTLPAASSNLVSSQEQNLQFPILFHSLAKVAIRPCECNPGHHTSSINLLANIFHLIHFSLFCFAISAAFPSSLKQGRE